MKSKFMILLTLLICISCNLHKKESLNKKYPLQEPKVRTVFNLDTVHVSSFPMQIIWDNHVALNNKNIEKSKKYSKYIASITNIQQGPDSTLLLLDSQKNRIIKFSIDGKWLGTIGNIGSGPGEMIEPLWMVYRNNCIYIADPKNGRLQILDAFGNYIRQISNFRSGEDKYRFAVGNNGEIVTRTNRGDDLLIVCYDSLGKVINKFGNYLEHDKYYYNKLQQHGFNAMSIYVDSLNTIWCVFDDLPIIRRYDFKGDFLEEIIFVGNKLEKTYEKHVTIDRQNKEVGSKGNMTTYGSSPFSRFANFYKNKLFLGLDVRGEYCIEVQNEKSVITMAFDPDKFSDDLYQGYFNFNFIYYDYFFCWTYQKFVLRSTNPVKIK